MKRIAVIFFILLYFVSTSGIAYSSFYCCGKLKETYLFSHYDYSKDCKSDKKVPGCCDTKTVLAKVKDSHSASQQLKVSGKDFSKQLFTVAVSFIKSFQPSDQTISFALIHAPPLLSKQLVYLSVCNFRI